MKKILITGSLGYIGSVLTPFLEDRGYKTIGYDTGFFKDSVLYKLQETETILKDARDIGENDLKGIDEVVHLAGISNDPLKKLDAARVYDPTREYSFNIAKLCKKLGIKFIFASSCSIYGIGGDEFLTEESEVHPQTGYSINKLQIEGDLRSISDKDFSPIALRFATAFGLSPRIRFDVVVNMFAGMAFTEKAIVLNTDGTPWRPNLHILDFCEAIRRSIELDYSGGELLIMNVGDENNNLQVIQIAKTVAAAVPGCEVKFLNENPGLDKEGLITDRKVKSGGVDTRTYKVSFEKIQRMLPGFKCEWSVKRGVKETISKFEEIGLTREIFKNRGFYRLQQLEYLHENNFLSDDLRWLNLV